MATVTLESERAAKALEAGLKVARGTAKVVAKGWSYKGAFVKTVLFAGVVYAGYKVYNKIDSYFDKQEALEAAKAKDDKAHADLIAQIPSNVLIDARRKASNKVIKDTVSNLPKSY